jgi:hypothetical protein
MSATAKIFRGAAACNRINETLVKLCAPTPRGLCNAKRLCVDIKRLREKRTRAKNLSRAIFVSNLAGS